MQTPRRKWVLPTTLLLLSSLVIAEAAFLPLHQNQVKGLEDYIIFGDSLNDQDLSSAQQFRPTKNHIELTARHADGTVFAYGFSPNTVTDAGRNRARKCLWDVATTCTKYDDIGSGTGSSASEATQTALVTEVESRCTGAYTEPASFQAKLTCTVSYTATRAITEAGLFDATAAGNIWTYTDFAAINVNNGDSIEFRWTLND